MSKSTNPHELVLPTSWSRGVRSALLHVVSLAQYAAVYTRSWASESRNARVRLQADKDQLQQEVALLRAETAHTPPGKFGGFSETHLLAT
ncbi:MAG TPA: hypothetical protein VH120_06875, partial [Gemmataceae bacterium]|nr:hypothetical protein [Gemmataceae bacterium]